MRIEAPLPTTPAVSITPPSHLEIRPEQGEIGSALVWLEGQTESAGLPMRAQFALNLGLDETLANIVMHGFREQPGHERTAGTGEPLVRIECSSSGAGFDLVVRDNGVAFDPTRQEPGALAQSLEDATPGGHGLRLMRHFLHEIRYERIAGWNILHMHLRRDGAAQPCAD